MYFISVSNERASSDFTTWSISLALNDNMTLITNWSALSYRWQENIHMTLRIWRQKTRTSEARKRLKRETLWETEQVPSLPGFSCSAEDFPAPVSTHRRFCFWDASSRKCHRKFTGLWITLVKLICPFHKLELPPSLPDSSPPKLRKWLHVWSVLEQSEMWHACCVKVLWNRESRLSTQN